MRTMTTSTLAMSVGNALDRLGIVLKQTLDELGSVLKRKCGRLGRKPDWPERKLG